MNEKEIYPEADINEIITNAKSFGLPYPKRYRKGDFTYLYEKKLFKERAIVAIHILTRKIFAYSNYTGLWNELKDDKIKEGIEGLI